MANREIASLEAEQLNLKSILYKYLKYWYLFVLSTLLCLGGAYLYLLYATPEYSVSGTLQIKDDKKDGSSKSGNDEFDDSEIFQSSKNIHNESEVLKSKSLMHSVLSELELSTRYFVEGQVKDVEVYGSQLPVKVTVKQLQPVAYGKSFVLHIEDKNIFTLTDDSGVKAYKFGQEITKPYGTFTVVTTDNFAGNELNNLTVKFNDIQKLALTYTNRMEIKPVNKNASVLTITLTDPVKERGKAILTKLIEVYNKDAVADKNLIAQNTIKFIDERLKLLTTDLSNVEKGVERYKRQNEVTDVAAEGRLSMEQASGYSQQLTDYSIKIDVLQSLESYLTRNKGKYDRVPSTLNIQDVTLQDLIAKFNNLQLERQRMLRTSQPTNPIVVDITDQLASMQGNILENIRNLKSGLIIARNKLQGNYGQIAARKQEVPSIERNLLEITRQQGIRQALYQYLLQKREESALSLAANVAIARVIDMPIAFDEPVKPKKQLIYLLALLLGLGLPIAVIQVKDMLLNDRVHEIKDVELVTATPILGEIAHNDSKGSMVISNQSMSPVAELFRLIRANLHFATIGKENKVILITSSMSGEGKTFFSINLGLSLALTGKRVAVVDFDLRKSGLLQSLSLSSEYGVVDYLISDKLSVEEILVSSQIVPELYVVGSGPIPANPAELMLLPKVNDLIDDLKTRFDYVILDASPVGLVADPLALAPYIDSSIFLTRYNYTYKEQVNIIDDIFRNQKLNRPMIVLNDAKKGNGYAYGYGYGYQQADKRVKKRLSA